MAHRDQDAWSNPGEDRNVVQVELRPGSPGFENGLRVAYGLAADALVLKNGVPATRSRRRWCSRWERYACPVATPRSNGSGLLARVARWRGRRPRARAPLPLTRRVAAAPAPTRVPPPSTHEPTAINLRSRYKMAVTFRDSHRR